MARRTHRPSQGQPRCRRQTRPPRGQRNFHRVSHEAGISWSQRDGNLVSRVCRAAVEAPAAGRPAGRLRARPVRPLPGLPGAGGDHPADRGEHAPDDGAPAVQVAAAGRLLNRGDAKDPVQSGDYELKEKNYDAGNFTSWSPAHEIQMFTLYR